MFKVMAESSGGGESPGLESLLGKCLHIDAPRAIPKLIPERGQGGMFKVRAESSGGGESPGLEFLSDLPPHRRPPAGFGSGNPG